MPVPAEKFFRVRFLAWVMRILKAIQNMKMVNWKTTIGGVLASVGQGLMQIPEPAWLPKIGGILSSVGLLLLGASARDFNKSSEESVKKPPRLTGQL